MSDDICMYQLIDELKAENKQLTKELMLVEAERDEALNAVSKLRAEYSKAVSDAGWEREYLQAQIPENTWR